MKINSETEKFIINLIKWSFFIYVSKVKIKSECRSETIILSLISFYSFRYIKYDKKGHTIYFFISYAYINIKCGVSCA